MCKGVFEPIVVSKPQVDIPAGDAGTAITDVDIKQCFSGGKAPIRYGEKDSALSVRGLGIDSDGVISGTRSEASFAEVITNILIVDANGQEAEIKVKIGAINGPLAFDDKASGIRVSIPGGKKGTAVPAANLPLLGNGAIGGKKPYTWSKSTTNGPEVYGFTNVNFNAATGAFTSLTRPADKRAKGSFTMNLKDANNTVLEVPISFGEIID